MYDMWTKDDILIYSTHAFFDVVFPSWIASGFKGIWVWCNKEAMRNQILIFLHPFQQSSLNYRLRKRWLQTFWPGLILNLTIELKDVKFEVTSACGINDGRSLPINYTDRICRNLPRNLDL